MCYNNTWTKTVTFWGLSNQIYKNVNIKYNISWRYFWNFFESFICHFYFRLYPNFLADAEDDSVVGVEKSICEEVAGVLHDENALSAYFL